MKTPAHNKTVHNVLEIMLYNVLPTLTTEIYMYMYTVQCICLSGVQYKIEG